MICVAMAASCLKLPNNRLGRRGEKNVVGVSFLNDESGAVKVSVND